MFSVVTDTASDLPLAWCRDNGVGLVALHLRVGGKTLRDVYDVERGGVSHGALSGVQVSQPSVSEFACAFERAAAEGATEVVCVTVSSGASQTYDNAVAAARRVKERLRVAVVDSKSASAGQALVVRGLVSARDAGMGFEDAVRHAGELARHVTMLAVTPPGSPVLRGRIRNTPIKQAQASVCRRLGLSALVTFDENGGLVTTGFFRDSQVPAGRIGRLMCLDASREGPLYHIAVYAGHGRGLSMLERHVNSVGEVDRPGRVLVSSEAMESMIGYGAVGIAYIPAKYLTGSIVESGTEPIGDHVVAGHWNACERPEGPFAAFTANDVPA